ncbi:putative proline--tRNA ligase c19c7.06 [Phtheirospermum japonicum]|uniref:Putative proline--tRNA ligase c19c7.06 n=1 Tax=Phtheirospermum japonicum TaxID=374723 RepID=A0A830BFZ8_9LAMI|nr:putative proline--tRNA ligase c19c7.06 [Phtheirospermum japonicum]
MWPELHLPTLTQRDLFAPNSVRWDDLDVLARDFGLGARGKSNQMRSAPSDRRSNDNPLFSDVFDRQPKYTPSSNSNSNYKNSVVSDFDYDSIFKSSSVSEPNNSISSSNKASLVPVYDKPLYDDDIFDGLSGLKSKLAASTVRFEDDVFATISSPPTSKSRNQIYDFDDLLGNLGRNEKSNMSSNAKSSSNTKGFGDLLAGFGSGSSGASNSALILLFPFFAKWQIGVMIMVHGDDKGLVLPPKVPSVQVRAVRRDNLTKHDIPMADVVERVRDMLNHIQESLFEAAKRIYEEYSVVPVIKSKKSEHKKFTGGLYTTTVEVFIYCMTSFCPKYWPWCARRDFALSRNNVKGSGFRDENSYRFCMLD